MPCCRGFVYAAEKAIEESAVMLPLKAIKSGISGEVQGEEELGAECACSLAQAAVHDLSSPISDEPASRTIVPCGLTCDLQHKRGIFLS